MSSRKLRSRHKVDYYVPDAGDLDDDVHPEETIKPEPADEDEDEDVQAEQDEDDDDTDFLLGKAAKKADKIKAKLRKQNKNSKKNKKQKKKNLPFRFLDLPPEIRNMVYQLCLVNSGRKLDLITRHDNKAIVPGIMAKYKPHYRPIHQSPRWQREYRKQYAKDQGSHRFLYPVVMRISKAIHDEAAPLLYGQTLGFETPIVLSRFLVIIGASNRRLMRDIVVRGWKELEWPSWEEALERAFSHLLTATELRRVTFDRRVYDDGDNTMSFKYAFRHNHPIHEQEQFYFTELGKMLRSRIAIWLQEMDSNNISAKDIVRFSDAIFASQNEIDHAANHEDDDKLERRKKIFFENLKLN